MDDETRKAFADMMTRINDNHETLIERLRGIDASVAMLGEAIRSGNTTMALIVSMLADFGRRVTDLEKKG
jgi:hypothetical protein